MAGESRGFAGAAPPGRRDVRDAISEVVDCDVRLATMAHGPAIRRRTCIDWIAASGSDGVQNAQPLAVRDERSITGDVVADEWRTPLRRDSAGPANRLAPVSRNFGRVLVPVAVSSSSSSPPPKSRFPDPDLKLSAVVSPLAIPFDGRSNPIDERLWAVCCVVTLTQFDRRPVVWQRTVNRVGKTVGVFGCSVTDIVVIYR